jgi:hypothetical protein
MATTKVNRAITFTHAAGIVTFTSGNGDTFALQLADLSTEARDMAIVFGVARKVVNAAALDAGATVADKWAEVREVADRLGSGGAWNGVGREKGTGGAEGLVVMALARVYETDGAKAEATIVRTMAKKGLDRKSALKLWASTEKVATAIAAIKAERAAKVAKASTLDADDLLADID